MRFDLVGDFARIVLRRTKLTKETTTPPCLRVRPRLRFARFAIARADDEAYNRAVTSIPHRVRFSGVIA